jgi:transposase
MESMGLNFNYTVATDTVFASEENFQMMGECGLQYIVPVKRNSAEISTKELYVRDN